MSLLRSHYERHCKFCLGPAPLDVTLGEASCLVVSSPVERPRWGGTEPPANSHMSELRSRFFNPSQHFR